MQLSLTRTIFTPDSTLGEVYIDGVFECYSLEPLDRFGGDKVKGTTAIPVGTYTVVLDFSQRFQRVMPHVLDVPDFAGIRIHPGNVAANTEGCILVGQTQGSDSVGYSIAAFDALFRKLEAATNANDSILLNVSE